MPHLKNSAARLITINHHGKRYDVKPGDNPSTEVPTEVMKLPFVKNLLGTGDLISVVSETTSLDGDLNEERAELEEMTVAELKDHCKLLDLEGYSRMDKAELIEFILENR